MYDLLSVDFLCSQMEFHICKVACGTHHAHHKEQHEQGKPDSLHRTVDIDDYIPDSAALELLWGLGYELPYLRQLLVPCVKGVL